MPVVRLLINSYDPPSPARRAEFDFCLCRNLENPYIAEIHALGNTNGCRLVDRPKLIRVACDLQPTFASFIRFANTKATADDITIIANSDIYFDDTLQLAAAALPERLCLALTRWNLRDGELRVQPNPMWSQDAWVFRGPVPDVNAHFYLGKPGCDNRFAALIRDAGWAVANPCKSIRITHVHGDDVRWYSPEDIVRGPYCLIPPCSWSDIAAFEPRQDSPLIKEL